MASIDWDVDSYEATQPSGVIPAGKYVCIISDTSEKTSKAGANYVELELTVVHGEYQNRKLWDRLNLWHPNEKPRNIARGTLKSICDAIGVKAKDTQQLCNRPLLVTVVIENNEYNGSTTQQNVVKGYAKAERPQQQQPQQKPQQKPQGNPWGQSYENEIPF